MCLVPRDSHVERDAPRDVVILTCALFLWHALTFLKSIEPFKELHEVPPCLRKETCANKIEFVSFLMNTLSGIFFYGSPLGDQALAFLDWILGENFNDKIHTNFEKITIRT